MIIHTFHPRLSLRFTSLHFLSLPFTSHPFTSLHFTSCPFPSLYITSLHFPSLPFTSLHFPSLHFTSCPFPSLYIASLHFTTLHSPFFMSLQFWTFRNHSSKTLHLTSLTITFLTLFLKIRDLQGTVRSFPAGSLFHSLTVLFTQQCLPISVLCFLTLILRS